jgi:hypothetical protein
MMLDEYMYLSREQKISGRKIIIAGSLLYRILSVLVHCAHMAIGNISRASSLSASLAMVVG